MEKTVLEPSIWQMIINFLSENAILFSLLGLLLGVVGIVATILAFKKTHKKINPLFVIRNEKLLGEKIISSSRLKVIHKRQVVKNLSVAKVLIWNQGKKTLQSSDLANHGIRIKLKRGVKLLQAGIILESKKENDCKISFIGKQIQLKFDYFDKDEGVLIRVFHTGNSKEDISIEGMVKEFGKFKDWGKYYSSRLSKAILIMFLVLLYLIGFAFYDLTTGISYDFLGSGNEKISKILYQVPFILFYIWIFIWVYGFRSKVPLFFREELFLFKLSEPFKEVFKMLKTNFLKSKNPS